MNKERPILFSAPMVRAILTGAKTQTRRIVKPQPILNDFGTGGVHPAFMPPQITEGFLAIGVETMLKDNFAYLRSPPYGIASDRLWVKETFSAHGAFKTDGRIIYRADVVGGLEPHGLHWRPSIFMPRAASRLTLEIVDVRVERLQSISEADAEAEGAHRKIWITSPMSAGAMNARGERGTHRDGYKDIWDEINGGGSWSMNPWVWAITFRKL